MCVGDGDGQLLELCVGGGGGQLLLELRGHLLLQVEEEGGQLS